MPVFVRIPRRATAKTKFSWEKRLVEYTWKHGACWYHDYRIHYYYWDKYSVTWDANGDPQKGDFISTVVGSEGQYPDNGVGTDDSDGVSTVWYVFSYDAVLGGENNYWEYDWSGNNTITSTNRSEYPDSFTEYIPEYTGGGEWVEMQPCYEYVGSGAGFLVDTVYSEDENAYPENGLHTDGYWYIKNT